MKSSLIKPWLVGVAILLLSYLLWFISLQFKVFSDYSMYLLWMSPFIASFIVAFFKPNKKLLIGTMLAISSAVIAVSFNSFYQVMGYSVDFPSVKGGFILFNIILIYSFFLCLLGIMLGSIFYNSINKR